MIAGAASSRTIVVAGGGAVGLAIARALSLPSNEVVVIERNAAAGMEASARNSEVVHAGIYYGHASLKREACVGGKKLLYSYLDQNGIPYKKTGKIIVATNENEAASLQGIIDQATRNGVDDLRMLSKEDISVLEPNVKGIRGIISPSTGIFDSSAYILQLLADADGSIVYNCAVTSVGVKGRASSSSSSAGGVGGNKFVVETTQGAILCDVFINATGAGAIALASTIEGYPVETLPLQYYAKGSYFKLSPSADAPVFRHLVYPLPSEGGLGVHATLDLRGKVRFGPDVEWLRAQGSAGFVHEDGLMALEAPSLYCVDEGRAQAFYEAIRRYCPSLKPDSLVADYAGIRTKLIGPLGVAGLRDDYKLYSRRLRVDNDSSIEVTYSDFMVDGPVAHGIRGLYSLFGVESPGLTSSLFLAELVRKMVHLDSKST